MSESGSKPPKSLLVPPNTAPIIRKKTNVQPEDGGLLSPARANIHLRRSSEELHVDKPVSDWTVKDVELWLRTNQLAKFVPAVNKNKVTGKDLVNLNLNFVYENDFSPWDREALLSEVYRLTAPSKTLSDSRPTRYSTAQEQEKYVAAVRVAKNRDRSSSPSLVVFSRSPSPCRSSLLSIPAMKIRSRSESGVDGMSCDLTPTASPARKYLKRKSTPNVLLAAKGYGRRPSLYQVFNSKGPQCVFCTIVKRGPEGFNFSCEMSSNGAIFVKNVTGSSSLWVGDIILEVNGISLIRGDNSSSTELLLERLLSKSETLQLVAARLHKNSVSDCSDVKDLNNKLSFSEKKWHKLRDFLVDLKSDNFDPERMISDTPPAQIQEVKETIVLREEVQQLQEALNGHMTRVNDLQRTLDEKTGAIQDLERQRDLAIGKLETITLSNKSKQGTGETEDTSENSVVAGMYAEMMDNLKPETVPKTEVLKALRETITEAVTQKTYLDKLMCVVIEEAPWLLDIIDADLADLSDLESKGDGDGEEFC